MDQNSPNYLLQVLDKVYVYSDARTYPLSSYSYGIIPTDAGDPRMTTAKRQSLVDYLFYSICDGQKEIGPIGYSPLPINLVQASIDQITKLGPGQAGHPGADPNVSLSGRDVSSCNNPTFIAGHPEENHLALIAPMPPACDQAGQGPCGTGPQTSTPGGPSGNQTGSASGPGQSRTTTGPGRTTGGSGGGSTAGGTAGKTQSGKGSVGQGATLSGATQTGTAADQAGVAGPTGAAPGKTFVADGPSLARDRSVGARRLLGALALILFLTVLVAPPVLVLLFGRAKKEAR
jgi:hypothetical protein